MLLLLFAMLASSALFPFPKVDRPSVLIRWPKPNSAWITLKQGGGWKYKKVQRESDFIMAGLSHTIRPQSDSPFISQLHFFGVSCVSSQALVCRSYYHHHDYCSHHLLQHDQSSVLRQLLHSSDLWWCNGFQFNNNSKSNSYYYWELTMPGHSVRHFTWANCKKGYIIIPGKPAHWL